ncbi:hypothetical protein ES319_A04G055400v1 [Gossypium barbadense]|uniref:Uncharacterized protein n=1 Tax=Gossypium barbadense TaxID=3634 RepID=A0A5J5W2N9_GOSBA|nr:hypothetical protein ES319_A04G055400v1 [Gossypium barbadense]
MAGDRRCGGRAFELCLQSLFLRLNLQPPKNEGKMEFFVPFSNSITTTEKSLRWRARRDSGVVRGVEGRRYGRWYGTPVCAP